MTFAVESMVSTTFRTYLARALLLVLFEFGMTAPDEFSIRVCLVSYARSLCFLSEHLT